MGLDSQWNEAQDEPITECEVMGHVSDRVIYEDADYVQWVCDACGAEWFEDKPRGGGNSVSSDEDASASEGGGS